MAGADMRYLGFCVALLEMFGRWVWAGGSRSCLAENTAHGVREWVIDADVYVFRMTGFGFRRAGLLVSWCHVPASLTCDGPYVLCRKATG